MRPRPLHQRDDLIALVREYAPTRACNRAIREDRAQVLGGFAPPEGLPYWLVQVDSRHGNRWYIGIICDEPNNRFRPFWPERPDWRHWDGRIGGRSLKDGDSPNTYALRRAKARRHHGTTPEDATE